MTYNRSQRIGVGYVFTVAISSTKGPCNQMPRSIGETLRDQLDECRRAVARCADSPPTPNGIGKLRSEFGEPVADQLIEIASLQQKARKKLGEGTWWVTPRSLQQATPWQVAAIKATWFAEDEVFDLCCGIGGDTIGLSRRGPVTALDADPTMISFNEANLRAANAGHPRRMLCQDVTTFELPQGGMVHVDPDRRPSDRRVTDPDRYRPDMETVTKIVTTAQGAIVKLAPAAKPIGSPAESHRCWISLSGSVREQSLICGQAIERAGVSGTERSAVKVAADGSRQHFVPEVDVSVGASGTSPQELLVDPDSAIRAAGLTEAFAVQFDLLTVGGPAGFLTGTHLGEAASKLAVSGRILWLGGADDRRIRRELRRRDLFPEAIKVRGCDHDPVKLYKRYRKCGETPTTLWLGRSGDRTYAAITEPIENAC